MIAGILAVVGAAAFFALSLLEQRTADDLAQQKDQRALQFAQLDKTVGADLRALDVKAGALSELFDKQRQWEYVFGWFEQGLYRQTTITRLAVEDTGKLAMAGTVASYTDYAKLITSLTDQSGQRVLQSVRADSITPVYGSGAQSTTLLRVEYVISGQLTPAALKASALRPNLPPMPSATPTPTPPTSLFR
jgi:hypothetical protein